MSSSRYAEAIEAYKQAIKFNPNYAPAYHNLGISYNKLGLSKEALEAYKRAVKIKPGYAEAHLELGLTHLLLGDKQAALAEYNILSGLDQAKAAGLLESINKK
jgi:tetratricopeptide (TPR) repeat protein